MSKRSTLFALFLLLFLPSKGQLQSDAQTSVVTDSAGTLSQNTSVQIEMESEQPSSPEEISILIVEKIPSMLWALFAFAVLILLRRPIISLMKELSERIRAGSSLKIGNFELGSIYSTYATADTSDLSKRVEVFQDIDDIRENERNEYYSVKGDVMLVHQLYKSNTEGQLYDIIIYLLPHKSNLLNIESVSYYFGGFWNYRVFKSTDRTNSFAINTSAYGPFLCTALVEYTDREENQYLHRYIDFEMGQYAPRIIDSTEN